MTFLGPIQFDEEADSLYIAFKPIREGEVEETEEVNQGVYLDYDQHHKPVGIEIIGVSKMKSGEGRG